MLVYSGEKKKEEDLNDFKSGTVTGHLPSRRRGKRGSKRVKHEPAV